MYNNNTQTARFLPIAYLILYYLHNVSLVSCLYKRQVCVMYSQVPKNTLEYERPIKSQAESNKQTGVFDITRAKLASINPSHDNYSSKLIYVTQRRRLSSK